MIPREIRWVVGAGFLVCLLIVILLTVSYCSERARFRQEAAARATIASGRTAAAGDEQSTRRAADDERAAINAKVEAGTDAVRKAPDRRARSRAALRSLCDIDSSDARCRVFDAR